MRRFSMLGALSSLLVPSLAMASTSPTWQPIADEITGFTGLMFLIGGALLVIAGLWAIAKWMSGREFGEGMTGPLIVAICGIFFAVVVPIFQAQAAALGATLDMVIK